jgi:hypothetical protein
VSACPADAWLGAALAAPRHAHLDLEVLREALSQMLSEDDDDGYLIIQLSVVCCHRRRGSGRRDQEERP